MLLTLGGCVERIDIIFRPGFTPGNGGVPSERYYPQGDSNEPQELRETHEFARDAAQIAARFSGISSPADTGLKLILDAWQTLPDALNAGILAMIEAARKGP
jgi:hypothetical protein